MGQNTSLISVKSSGCVSTLKGSRSVNYEPPLLNMLYAWQSRWYKFIPKFLQSRTIEPFGKSADQLQVVVTIHGEGHEAHHTPISNCTS